MGYVTLAATATASECVCMCVGHMWALADMCSVCQQPAHKKGARELRVDTPSLPRPPAGRMKSNERAMRWSLALFPSKMWSRSSSFPLPPLYLFHTACKLEITNSSGGGRCIGGCFWLAGRLPSCLPALRLCVPLPHPPLRAYYRAIIEAPAK